MPVSQQRLLSLEVKRLKSLKDVTVSFENLPLTAILGPNGCGKSTVLHALACVYEPQTPQGEGHKFSNFFLPSTDALWEGSEMVLTHSFRDGATLNDRVDRTYSKARDRWAPRYANRPVRDVMYIGIDSCVPMIESESRQVRINYETTQITEEIVLTILEKASYVLDRQYNAFNRHNAQGREFIGVSLEGIQYSALSMSAGEQKVFFVLEKVFRAPSYSLLLLDELDLLLHEKALKRLVTVINERAAHSNLQVVFTTHRESLIEFEGEINIRHLFSGADRTFCLEQTKPDAIARLTGSQPKPIEIFVEDDLAAAIVQRLLAELKATRWVSVTRFGAAINSFTMLGGLLLRGEDCTNLLVMLDGDVYRQEHEIVAGLNRVVTGHGPQVEAMREAGENQIRMFALPAEEQPESYIHRLLRVQDETDNEGYNEIIEMAKDVAVVADNHDYLREVIERLGVDKQVGLTRIVEVFSSTPGWNNFVQPLLEWLEPKVNECRENG